jgi:hypothetical protein
MALNRTPRFFKLALPALLTALLPALALGGGDVGDKRVRVTDRQAPFAGQPVPQAPCGATDWTETGLQGQTTTAERMSGLSELGFQCNLELVGQYQARARST